MKIGKAITAMQRGEVVRRRGQSGGFRISDGTLEHQSTDKAWSRSGPYFFDNNLKYDDWVIVRKKPKARRFSEDELEPVGTEARVGDIIVATEDGAHGIGPARCGDLFDYASNGLINSRRSFGPTMRSNGWFFHKDEPSLRILKRPAKPLRDVFADPRVNDVVKFKFFPVETIRYVDADMVSTWDGKRATSWSRHGGSWGLAPDFTVISRAPEEVAPK